MFYELLSLSIILLLWKWLNKPDPSMPPALPGKLPIIGHSLQLIGNRVEMFNTAKKTALDTLEMGGVTTFYVGLVGMFYAISDPEDCLTVYNECFQKHYMYDFARPLLSNGLINADVATWKQHRKLLSPAFNQHVLDGFIDIFNTQAKSLVRQFSKEVGKAFNHETYIRSNNLETICATSLGAIPGEHDTYKKEYLPLLEEVLQIFNKRFTRIWFHLDFIFNMSSLKKRQDEIINQMNEFSSTLVRKKKIQTFDSIVDENESKKFKPFIDLITELGKDVPSMTEWQIRGETSTIIVGGHDTTATTLTIALTLLGSYPQVQEKAYQEVLEVLGDSKRDVVKEDLSKLVYIEAVAKETLRLYPSAPVLTRQLDKDINIKNYTLKAGYGCMISIYGAQRHAMWGPDAHDFRPERWFEKETLPESKYYAAFGLGRRNCIGKQYAFMMMKITLAHLIRSYSISSDVSEMEIQMDAMIKPAKGFYITLERRQTPG